MDYTQRLEALSRLGDRLLQTDATLPVLQQAYLHNNWFTIDMQLRALHQWGRALSKENLTRWASGYSLDRKFAPKTIALILAGNIPLVGLHDVLSVLLSGHIALVKTSSDDDKLIRFVLDELKSIEPGFADQIRMVNEEKLTGFDAVIATGSNNSNRYFEYYFKEYPSILRRNRNSVAVITGEESESDFDALADDVFVYFGLGCRNVSKLLLPMGFRLDPIFLAFERYKEIIHHNKYANNYTYHKALFLMNLDPHLDNGFLIVKEDEGLGSPLGVLFFQFYETKADLDAYLEEIKDQLQCVVGKEAGVVPFGKSQDPELWDYADGEDTVAFLLNLK